ncbi:MAG: rod-binding protein, partial [Rhodobacteraceae bacterium]|nr:rod-binding protein [Paracoccaceae bacterium]
MDISSAMPVPTAQNTDRIAELRETAKAFEASFLAEMLKNTGLGKSRDSFGGGAGEDAFASLLTTEQAKLMADNGGIGLAEHIFN